jgi:RNA polymerase sigma-70 factor (ECF subfamily)
VHRLVRRYVDNASDAEDLTQEIFCDLYRCVANFRGASALSTWVYRVAVNHCLKYRQRRKPDSVNYEETDIQASDWHVDPAKSALKADLANHVHTALEALSPVHYDVVVLCELQGLTYQECASALNIPVGTVKSRLFNAIRSLRLSLKSYVCDDSEPRLSPAEMQR